MKVNTSFLIQCDEEFTILHTYWNQPIFLFSPYQKKLTELFNPQDAERLLDSLHQTLKTREAITCNYDFQLTGVPVEISLCFIAKGNTVLVFGYEIPVNSEDGVFSDMMEFIHRFMKVISMTNDQIVYEDNKMIREQFEQIQKLNNEMTNMQRQLKKANSQLKQLNLDLNNRLVKDALTGLVSRYQYREEIDYIIRSKPKAHGIFVFLDLDNFKRINDTYGHQAGDNYLKEFARRLLHLPFEEKICIRIAGDEFGLYLHGYTRVLEQDLLNIWKAIQEIVLNESIPLNGVIETFRCSVGMAVYGKDTDNIYDLIEFADYAMYQAKQKGKNTFSVFCKEEYRR